MKKLILLFVVYVSLMSCKKDRNENSPLHDKVDGFYKIISANSNSEEDLNDDNKFSKDLFLEIPLLKTSTLDVVVNKVGNSFHLLWLEQDDHSSNLQTYNTEGMIYKFNFDINNNLFSPISYKNQNQSEALAAPVEMMLLKDGIISCKIMRLIKTSKGTVELKVTAVYQKDPSIQRSFN